MVTTLFKPAKTGNKVQLWEIVRDGDKYKTIEGVVGKKVVESEWTQCVARNVCKIDEVSAEKQAERECFLKIQEKRGEGYDEDITKK